MNYKRKACTGCGAQFTPNSGSQKRCDFHRGLADSPLPVYVPASLTMVGGRNRRERAWHIHLCLKLARTASKASEHDLVWRYVWYAHELAAGKVFRPEDVYAYFGHGFGPVRPDFVSPGQSVS